MWDEKLLWTADKHMPAYIQSLIYGPVCGHVTAVEISRSCLDGSLDVSLTLKSEAVPGNVRLLAFNISCYMDYTNIVFG